MNLNKFHVLKAERCGWSARYFRYGSTQYFHVGIDPMLGSNCVPRLFFGFRSPCGVAKQYRITLPHIPWRIARRTRKIGGMLLYRLAYRFWRQFDNKQPIG